MIVPLVDVLVDDPGLLEQVLLNAAPIDRVPIVVADHRVLAEPGRVVVPDRLGVPERLEQVVGGQDLLLDVAALGGRGVPAVVDSDQELHDQLGRLGLAGAGLARDDDTLVAAVALHPAECTRADREDVRRQRADELALVLVDLAAAVDLELLVRVDRD